MTVNITEIRRTAMLLERVSRELNQMLSDDGLDWKTDASNGVYESVRLSEQVEIRWNEEIVRQAAEMIRLSQSLEKAAAIYEKCEQSVADVFDMETLPVSEPVFATSYFDQLRRHEYLIPIREGT